MTIIASTKPKPPPITNSGLRSAHLNKTALIKECIQFRPIIANIEKKVAKSENKNGKKAITAIKFKGMQFNDQMVNERANADIVNKTNDDFATAEANGNTIQNNGTDRISNRSKKYLRRSTG